jgi:hypothetical protein
MRPCISRKFLAPGSGCECVVRGRHRYRLHTSSNVTADAGNDHTMITWFRKHPEPPPRASENPGKGHEAEVAFANGERSWTESVNLLKSLSDVRIEGVGGGGSAGVSRLGARRSSQGSMHGAQACGWPTFDTPCTAACDPRSHYSLRETASAGERRTLLLSLHSVIPTVSELTAQERNGDGPAGPSPFEVVGHGGRDSHSPGGNKR